MNHKKILIPLILITLFIGIGRATVTTNITSPEEGAIKNQDFTLEWEPIDEARCYQIRENGETIGETSGEKPDNFFTIDISNRDDGEYTYKIKTDPNRESCDFAGDPSDPITITVDTTPPSFESRSPVGDRVDVDLDEIIMEFDSGLSEKMDKNYTEKDFKTTPGINGNLRWDDEETLIYDIEEGFNLNYSKEYEISLEAKDKAGNTEHFSWSFETR